MAKSNAERQREFKARRCHEYKRLDLLLPVPEYKLLSGNAKKLGITKADYIVKLLHGNNNYDGTLPLQPVIAELLGCSIKSQKTIARAIKLAKLDLSITSKAKNMPKEMRVQIFNQIKFNTLA